MALCVDRSRRFLSPNFCSKKAIHNHVSYEVLTDAEKAMKATLFSFSDIEIDCRDIAEATSVEERKELFGTFFIPATFMAYEFVLSLIC